MVVRLTLQGSTLSGLVSGWNLVVGILISPHQTDAAFMVLAFFALSPPCFCVVSPLFPASTMHSIFMHHRSLLTQYNIAQIGCLCRRESHTSLPWAIAEAIPYLDMPDGDALLDLADVFSRSGALEQLPTQTAGEGILTP